MWTEGPPRLDCTEPTWPTNRTELCPYQYTWLSIMGPLMLNTGNAERPPCLSSKQV